MPTTSRDVVVWARKNWKTLSGAAAFAAFLGSSAVAAWWALWVSNHDHGLSLLAIQAEQARQVIAIEGVKTAGAEDLRRFAELQQRWQDKSEKRDEDIVRQLATMNHSLALIQGQLRNQAAALLPGWRTQNAPRTGAEGGTEGRMN